ncbi:MAG TPA: NADH-quinone oxidoreductase subunit J, partial [Planctomycetota bacterium]|nr:NADH-quinone oxidoreductase subunit J [Planctomycetota bacterium]
MAETLFYALSALAVAFGVGVVSARLPIMSVLSLLGSFVCLAGIYLLAGFQFLAAAQLLVYAGAIMVLFLFVIMLLEQGSLSGSVLQPLRATVGTRKLLVAGAVTLGLAVAGVLAATRADLP